MVEIIPLDRSANTYYKGVLRGVVSVHQTEKVFVKCKSIEAIYISDVNVGSFRSDIKVIKGKDPTIIMLNLTA